MSQPALSPSFIARQRERLEQLRESLLHARQPPQAGHADADSDVAAEPDGDTGAPGQGDVRDIAGHEVNRTLHYVSRQRLADIERALRKIDEGTYGFSDLSGDPIPSERLEATPEAVRTVEEERSRESASR